MSERSRKANYIRQSGIRGIISWVILLLFIIKIIYMSYKNGMLGMTYYAYASAVFFTFYILLGFAIAPVIKKMVSFHITRGSYRNASKVYRVITGFVVVISVMFLVPAFICSAQISMALFGTVLCSLLIKMMTLALLFWIPAFCLKGYIEGIGNPMPGIYADAISHVVGLVVTILFQPMFAEYGRKVAALVRQDSYAYAYAASSAGLGLAVGGFVSLLFLMLVHSAFGRELKMRIRTDEIRKTDSAQDIIWNFFGNYLKSVFVNHIGVFLAILLMIMYGNLTVKNETGAGMIYTGIIVPLMPAAFLAWQMVTLFTRQLAAIMKQADFHHAKEKMSFYLKLLSYSILPYVAALFALAPIVAGVFFDYRQSEFESLIRIGAVVGCLICYGLFFRQVFFVLVKPYMRNLFALLLGGSGIAFYLILGHGGVSAEMRPAYAYMLACLLYLLLTCFVVLKKIRIYNRLLQSVVIPFVSPLFVAAVAFGVYILLMESISGWILSLVCGIIIYLLHNILTVVLGVFESHEWSEIPASGFPVSFSKMIGKY